MSDVLDVKAIRAKFNKAMTPEHALSDPDDTVYIDELAWEVIPACLDVIEQMVKALEAIYSELRAPSGSLRSITDQVDTALALVKR